MVRALYGTITVVYTHEMPVPNHDEVEFVLEILDKIAAPALGKVKTLLETVGKWDNVARNDFCR